MRYFRDRARAHIGWAVATLHWPMDAAWAATPCDIILAHEGVLKFHGLTADGACDAALLTDLMKSFPDG